MLEIRGKAELELERVDQQIYEAVDNDDRRVHVEHLVTSCRDSMTRAVDRFDLLLALILKLDDSASLFQEPQTCLNVMRTANDEMSK